MRVLLVGNGGREHALGLALARSPRCGSLLATRPNAGLVEIAEPVDLASDDVTGLADLAEREGVDLTVVGPEAPLCAGLVDVFRSRGLRAFGPVAAAARIEGSKAFAKALMIEAGIPTASGEAFTEPAAAREFVRRLGVPVAVKADGLAAGKGVFLCDDAGEADLAIDEVLRAGSLGAAGSRVVVEALVAGEEASFIALCDGERVLPLASSQDHKRAFDGDRGPNTGGMGAYSPAPVVTRDVGRDVVERVLDPAVRALAARGTPFVGFLYAGLMVTPDRGPVVLEFNARLGDPEAQALLVRLRSDLLDVFDRALDGRLEGLQLDWDPRPSLTVVLASGGYPGPPLHVGSPIRGLEAAAEVEGVVLHHAATRLSPEGRVLTAGGRVLAVTALGDDLAGARARAYDAASRISWPEVHYRTDIAWRALAR